MAVDLGSIITVDGSTSVSGIVSGIDTNTLIQSLVDARSIPVTNLETTIETNDLKVTKLGELNSLLSNLSSSVDFLRNQPGVNTASNNGFEFRDVNLSSTLSTVSDYVSVSAEPGVSTGSYEFSIGAIAKEKIAQTGSFSSSSADITEAAGGTTAGQFSAGTFHIAGAQLTANSSDTLEAGDYSSYGTATGVVAAAGYTNFAIGATGDTRLVGNLQGYAVTVDGTNVDITIDVNGNTYTADDVVANAGGDGQSIADATVITFSNAETGNSFQITTSGDYNINANQTNADNFATALDSALSGVSVRQARNVTEFSAAGAASTVLDGLDNDDIRLISDDFDPANGNAGRVSNFIVTEVSGTGNNDASITLQIDGEVFSATGLGDDGSDTETGNITLTNIAGDKTFHLNINDAGVIFDLSTSTTAQAIEDALNTQLATGAAEITINAGDSLVDIAAAINGQRSVTGVSATIVQADDSAFHLTVRSDNTGLDEAFEIYDPDGVISETSLSTIQTANDSLLTVDGIEVSRGANTFSDVIDGLSFSISQVTPDYGTGSATKITASVTNDTATAEATIVNFVNAYNDFRAFVQEQTVRDTEGNLSEDSVLSSSTTLKTIIQQISAEITSVVNGAGTDYSSLGSVGIGVVDFEGSADTDPISNILDLDSNTLINALTNNFEEVRDVFEYSFSANSSSLDIFERSNSSTLTDFTFDIDDTRTAGEEVHVNDANGTFLFYATLSGGTITGIDGTSLEGTTFIYTGDGSDVIDVEVSYGVADRIFNLVEGFTENDGVIDQEIEFLNDEETRIESDIERLERSINNYRELLQNQFVALETAVSQINYLLDFLDANNALIFKSE